MKRLLPLMFIFIICTTSVYYAADDIIINEDLEIIKSNDDLVDFKIDIQEYDTDGRVAYIFLEVDGKQIPKNGSTR